MCNKLHTHALHLVMHKVTSTVTRISCKDYPSRGVFFDCIHHFQCLHLQTLWNLEGDKPIVILLDSLNQVIKFELMSVHVHLITISIG